MIIVPNVVIRFEALSNLLSMAIHLKASCTPTGMIFLSTPLIHAPATLIAKTHQNLSSKEIG